MRYAAFLRGINVGGRRVTGPELSAPFEALGFRAVASFLASGNIAFSVDAHDGTDGIDVAATTDATDLAELLEPRIEAALADAFGYGVDVFVRTAAEVADVARHQPFSADDVDASGGKLQVTFLRRAPTRAGVEEALTHASDQNRLAFAGREWYWLPAGGLSDSSLDVRAIERAIGRGTTRTANTVARLHAKWLSG
jgi:uncharacterized protein (DUF1697 family)